LDPPQGLTVNLDRRTWTSGDLQVTLCTSPVDPQSFPLWTHETLAVLPHRRPEARFVRRCEGDGVGGRSASWPGVRPGRAAAAGRPSDLPRGPLGYRPLGPL